MSICINCGQETDNCLCDKCKSTVDIEKLCESIIEYKPGLGQNILWDNISADLYSPYNFKNVIFALTAELPSPRKEYRRILCMSSNSCSVIKNSRQWLYEVYEICKSSTGLSVRELNRVKGIVLDALYKDYFFAEAEELATELMESKQDELSKQVYMTLVDFYTKTRRYDEAGEILAEAEKFFADDEYALSGIRELADNNAKYREKADNGKQEYMPNPKEAKQKYVDFLATLGIEVKRPNKSPQAIPKDQYPNPVETREANFDSFVAFDLETTGLNSKIDSIIEFGAVKVVNGKVVDSQEFTFQELVKPYKSKVSEEVQQLTGITPDDVKVAREMWDVTPDFLEFVGDNVLVGFNCIALDSKFLMRAGRYSNIVIDNKYFDVMRYAGRFKEQLGIDSKKFSLKSLSQKLEIENPRAHRALADAITTAKVYLKLRELEDGSSGVSMDDMLSDIEDW